MVSLQLQYNFDMTMPESPDIEWRITPEWMVVIEGPSKAVRAWYIKHYDISAIEEELERLFPL